VENNKLQVLPSIRKPQRDTKFAKRAADILVDIVKQNKWAIKLGGDKEHLVYEAWQTLGKYYGYTVETYEAEEVEIAGIAGFKAKARVVNENTGVEVGGAEAYCMRDEGNWTKKPTFQLASMAQTRAGAKALRQILSFVVALAGYNPTPAEEMTGDEHINGAETSRTETGKLASAKQTAFIFRLLKEKGHTEKELTIKYGVSIAGLSSQQASTIIENLMQLPGKTKESPEEDGTETTDPEINIDEVAEAIDQNDKSMAEQTPY
jgi:hypothetical protein